MYNLLQIFYDIRNSWNNYRDDVNYVVDNASKGKSYEYTAKISGKTHAQTSQPLWSPQPPQNPDRTQPPRLPQLTQPPVPGLNVKVTYLRRFCFVEFFNPNILAIFAGLLIYLW